MVVNVSIVKSLRYIYLHRANWHPNLHFLKRKKYEEKEAKSKSKQAQDRVQTFNNV